MQQQRHKKFQLLLVIPMKVLYERYNDKSLQYLQQQNLARKIHHIALVT